MIKYDKLLFFGFIDAISKESSINFTTKGNRISNKQIYKHKVFIRHKLHNDKLVANEVKLNIYLYCSLNLNYLYLNYIKVNSNNYANSKFELNIKDP